MIIMIEIERKFLVNIKKLPFKLSELGRIEIKQLYLNPEDDYVIRIRCVDFFGSEDIKRASTSYNMEIKNKGLLKREEYKVNITKQLFNEMSLKCTRYINKTRYIFIEKTYTYEIDVYDDFNESTVEVEFNSVEDAKDFIKPDWFGDDITYDDSYKNVNLALTK